MSIDLGYGLSGFGNSIFGYGTPGVSDSSAAKMFIKSDGTKGNVAKIDFSTGDYVLDAGGNPVGDNSVNQMVYLALKTTKNSSSLRNFGIDLLSIKTVTENIKLKFNLAVSSALKHMTDRKLISIISVDVNQIINKPGAITVNVKWRDETSGDINSIKLL